VLTATGEATLRQTWPTYARAIVEHFARHLSVDEAELVASVLGRVAVRGAEEPD
jgi:hypothetical protein